MPHINAKHYAEIAFESFNTTELSGLFFALEATVGKPAHNKNFNYSSTLYYLLPCSMMLRETDIPLGIKPLD